MTQTHQTRRLCAILLADVVGYSRMMAADEAGALAALNRHRRDEFDPVVAAHNGRIVKLMGDGALVEFASVVDAVNCALAIQIAALAREGLALRIGVNLGDIILQGDDIYGDGVNIAARLEPLAAPGGIAVSSVVHESVQGRVGAAFADGGLVEVKNIDRPVRVWRWHPDGSKVTVPVPVRGCEGPSVAVLAFANMSGDPEQEYFADGIAEDIITDLSKVSGLTVMARNSSFAFKGRSVDIRTVGRELGVGHVLEGSVRRAGQRVRVTAQLIDAATGAHLWADRYDGDLADVFGVQDAVTLQIVAALKVRLTPVERAAILREGTASPQAHDAFLRMRDLHFSPNINKAIWTRAIEHGQRVVELDPGYAEAIGQLSTLQWLDWYNGWTGDSFEVIAARAEAYAVQALAASPLEPWALLASAAAARWRGELDTSRTFMAEALARSPDFGISLYMSAEVALLGGQPTDALAFMERAVRLDPAMSHMHLQLLGQAHFLLHRFETAATVFRERTRVARETDIGRGWLAASLGHLGEIDAAQAVWADLMAIKPDFRMTPRLARFGYQRPQDPALVLEGLVKAGLPTGA